MIALLQNYSLSDILIFIVILGLAVKSVVTFFDWVHERIQRVFNKQHSVLSEKEELEKRLQHGSQIMNKLQKNQQEIDKTLEDLSNKIDMLIESDKDDIKSFITREHHRFCYHTGWIDDFSLDCIEKRYKHYKNEGGNTFIDGFMEDLRALPKSNPSQTE